MQRIFSNSQPTPIIIGHDRCGHPLQVGLPISAVQKMDVVNVTLRKYDRYQGNQETLVHEKHFQQLLPDDELNFITDFYLDAKTYDDDEFYFRNIDKLIAKYQQTTHDAYELATFVTKQLLTEELIKADRLKLNRKNVTQRIKHTLSHLKQNKNEDALKWQYNLKRLFHTMREAVEHILNAAGDELIKQKEHITDAFLIGLPRRNVAEIKEYLKSVRQLVSKKTDELNIMKQEHGDDFDFDDKTVREYSRSSAEDSQQSDRLTQIRVQTKKLKQKEAEKQLEPYFDHKKLQQKWKMDNEEKIKGTIRRIIVKQTLSEAEHVRARAYRLEQEKKGKPKSYTVDIKQNAKQPKKKPTKSNKPAPAVKEFKRTLTREEMKSEQFRQEFFTNYTKQNSIGEQFRAAIGYANIF